MMSKIPDYSLVLGVDANHLEQLKLVLPTWARFKPSLLNVPWVVFYDVDQIDPLELNDTLRGWSPGVVRLSLVPWPSSGVTYSGVEGIGRFGDAQREKMLSGFVHVSAKHVQTVYSLKLDLDVVATGMDDWIDPSWFGSNPAIIGHPWGYSKPQDQVLKLDAWVVANAAKLPSSLVQNPPLNLIPNPGSSCVRHARIISWCSFVKTEFVREVSRSAEMTCGIGKLPVPSQDGTLFYYAKRSGFGIVRTSMKERGWKQCANTSALLKAATESMMSKPTN